MMGPKLICPNSEDVVASVFTETQLSTDKNNVVMSRQKASHIIFSL